MAFCFVAAFLAPQAQLVRSLVPMLSTTALGCGEGGNQWALDREAA